MFSALRIMLDRLIVHGRLVAYDASGQQHLFGDGSPPRVGIRLLDRATERAIAFDPHLALGEAYMAGRLQMTEGTIADFLDLALREAEHNGLPRWTRGLELARRGLRRLSQFNPVARSRRNVAHHYDIDGSIYDLFLDSDRQYSCAYFDPGTVSDGADLEDAQLAKKRHIAAKLALKPGLRILDIGSGWGGLALYLAEACAADVTGITLSQEQLATARSRAEQKQLGNRVEFRLEDYRALDREFDRIVSVGMFEHVGINHYGTYFSRIAELLADDGVALIHTIGRSDGPGYTNPFIGRYIFPGGYSPALSEMLPAIERSGLIVADVEVLRLHYAETLKAWRQRFAAQRQRAVALEGEAFARMWEFYLAGAEASFRHQGLVVFQLQLVRSIDALPLTRDYIAAAERQLALRDRKGPAPLRMAGE